MSYQELFRLTSQRSANKVARANFDRVGIPAYPDYVYSELIERIKLARCNKDKIVEILEQFYASIADITDGYLRYFPQDIQDGYTYVAERDFTIRKSTLLEFKKVCQVKERKISKLREYRSFTADMLSAKVISADRRDRDDVDDQGLIRFLHFLEIIYGDTVNLDEVSVEQINAFLNAPIILPLEIVSHRCCCSHSERTIVRGKSKEDRPPLPGIGDGDGKEDEVKPEDCNCEKDTSCKDPSKHCICIRPYVTDLLVVKEKLDRYETGDIAYIENVMSGEKRVRNHRNLTRSEDFSETETETTKYEENDHQVTDKSSLQSEVSRTVQSDLSIDAGVTYNNKFGFGEITASANVASNTSRSTSNRIARTKARDVVNRSITKLEERVRELRSKRVIKEVEESNKHVFNNVGADTDHINGFYYWVNKVSKAQVYNYGLYMMFDQVLTTPSAMYKELILRKKSNSIDLIKPELPKYDGDNLTLDMITEADYLAIVSENPVQGIEAPINKITYINVPLTLSLTDTDSKEMTSALTKEFNVDYIPEGYLATYADVRGKVLGSAPKYTKGNDEISYSIIVGNVSDFDEENEHQNGNFNNKIFTINKTNIALNGSSVVGISASIYGTMAVNLTANVKIKCERKESVYENWRMSVFNTIMEDYNSKLQAYNDALQNQKTEKIKGRNPFLNREIERNELKRQVIAMLMCDYFNENKALMHNVKDCGYPEPDFKRLEKEGKIIQFFEQVFEWKLMNYIFYSDMWADKCTWADLIDQDSGDPLFDKFLQAGAAKVQVPIRDGMGEVFNWFLITGQIWGQSGNPPMVGDENYVSIIQEIKEDKQCQYTDRPGVIDFGATPTATKELILSDSTYYWSFLANDVDEGLIDNDIDREIVINCKVYKIISIEEITPGDNTKWKISVDRVVEPGDIQFHKHSVGAKCIGPPWEVMYGTNLVYLKDGEIN